MIMRGHGWSRETVPAERVSAAFGGGSPAGGSVGDEVPVDNGTQTKPTNWLVAPKARNLSFPKGRTLLGHAGLAGGSVMRVEVRLKGRVKASLKGQIPSENQ
jgi:hypothetical protein